MASNSSVKDAQNYKGSPAAKIAANLLDTVVPAVVRDPDSLSMFNQPNAEAKLRDEFFVIYQTNFIFGMGLVGGPFAIWLFYRAFRRSRKPGEETLFWLWLAPCALFIGVAVVGERDLMGVAHLTLIPVEALGITLVAAAFPWRRMAAMLVLAGCLMDFSFGVFLQARVQNLDNTPERVVFQGLANENGHLGIGLSGLDSMTYAAWLNWFWKNRDNLCGDWLKQLAALPQDNPEVQQLTDQVRHRLAEGPKYWDGWFPRHGGAITALGDHMPGFSFVALLMLCAGLMWQFGRQALRLAPAPAAQPARPPKAARKKSAGKR